MNIKKRGLGRGLDVLLGENRISDKDNLKVVPINEILPGSSQPRGEIPNDSIKGLSESIKSQGLMQPILVRKIEGDKYEIIAGERRWRAARLAKLTKVPVVIKDVKDDSSALAMALVENLQREDLNPIEEAKGLERLIKEFGLTHSQVAESVGKSRTSVTNLLRLLNSDQQVQKLLLTGKLEQGHVRALLTLNRDDQIKIAKTIISANLNVRQTEAKVKSYLNSSNKNKKQSKQKKENTDHMYLENEISDLLNLPVKINMDNPSKGKVIISFSMIEELQGFLHKIKLK